MGESRNVWFSVKCAVLKIQDYLVSELRCQFVMYSVAGQATDCFLELKLSNV